MRLAKGSLGRGAVVTTVEQQRVLFEAGGFKMFAEHSDRPVHRRDLGIPLAEHFALRTLGWLAGFV